jgi:hypothetical protein
VPVALHNRYTDDVTKSQSLLCGPHFGVVTDDLTGSDGSLVVLSKDMGTRYQIDREHA